MRYIPRAFYVCIDGIGEPLIKMSFNCPLVTLAITLSKNIVKQHCQTALSNEVVLLEVLLDFILWPINQCLIRISLDFSWCWDGTGVCVKSHETRGVFVLLGFSKFQFSAFYKGQKRILAASSWWWKSLNGKKRSHPENQGVSVTCLIWASESLIPTDQT